MLKYNQIMYRRSSRLEVSRQCIGECNAENIARQRGGSILSVTFVEEGEMAIKDDVKSERLRELRKIHLRMTQKDFGAVIGLSAAGVSRLEKGCYHMSTPLKKLVIEGFGVDEDWLRGEDGEPFKKGGFLYRQNNDEELDLFKLRVTAALLNTTDEEWRLIKKLVENGASILSRLIDPPE